MDDTPPQKVLRRFHRLGAAAIVWLVAGLGMYGYLAVIAVKPVGMVGAIIVPFSVPAMALLGACIVQMSRPSPEDDQRRRPPWWSRRLGWVFGAVIVPMLLHFGVLLYAIGPAGPGIIDGAYVRHDHGRVVDQISRQEYRRLRLLEQRLFLGQTLGGLALAAGISFVVAPDLFDEPELAHRA